MSQCQGYADVNMGVGVLVIGLAGTILGEAILGRDSLLRQIAAPVVGSLFHIRFVAMAMSLGFKPSGVKLPTGHFVLAALGAPIPKSSLDKRTGPSRP